MTTTNEQPIGTINGVYLYQSTIDQTRALVEKYIGKAENFRLSALGSISTRRKNGYKSQYQRAVDNEFRMRAELEAQLARVGKWGIVTHAEGESAISANARKAGSATSAAKSKAARANGAKGGRPRKAK